MIIPITLVGEMSRINRPIFACPRCQSSCNAEGIFNCLYASCKNRGLKSYKTESGTRCADCYATKRDDDTFNCEFKCRSVSPICTSCPERIFTKSGTCTNSVHRENTFRSIIMVKEGRFPIALPWILKPYSLPNNGCVHDLCILLSDLVVYAFLPADLGLTNKDGTPIENENKDGTKSRCVVNDAGDCKWYLAGIMRGIFAPQIHKILQPIFAQYPVELGAAYNH